MSAAFAATGGGLAITHGIEGMASGFRSGNSAMAAFAASQALLDLGRFAEDMRSVSAATGGATTVFGTLGNVMRNHPLMTIAAVLAGAAATMAIFADGTGEAADEFDRLADSMEKIRISRGAAELLGLTEGDKGYEAQIRSVAEQFQTGGMTYGQMARALGASPGSLAGLQQMGGVAYAPQRYGSYMDPSTGTLRQNVRYIQGGGGETTPFMRLEEQQVTREAAQAILRTLLNQVRAEAKSLQATGRVSGAGGAGFDIFAAGQPGGAFARGGTVYPAGYGTGAGLMRQQGMPGTAGYQPEALTGGIGMPFGTGFGIQFGMQAGAQMQAYAQEQAVLAQQRMDELIAQGQEFGQTIGDAFFRVAEGTMTARQAMAELVRMFAQMGAQSVFRQIGGRLGEAFAQTQAQATANADPGPIAPNA
jgi:hypothetical protein